MSLGEWGAVGASIAFPTDLVSEMLRAFQLQVLTRFVGWFSNITCLMRGFIVLTTAG